MNLPARSWRVTHRARGSWAGAIALAITLLAGLLPATPALALRAPETTSPYEAWGNDSVGNCPFAAIANLVRMHWPTAPITGNEVIRDWREYNSSIGPLPFLFQYGLAGHKIESYAPATTRAAIIQAANSGGALAMILGGEHAVAVVGANSKGVYFVTWGTLLWVNWVGWEGLDPISVESITWQTPGTSTVMFDPNCGGLSPIIQIEPTGSTEPLAAPSVNEGDLVTPLGWAPSIVGTQTLYQGGQSWEFTGNVVMSADWPLEATPAGTVCSD